MSAAFLIHGFLSDKKDFDALLPKLEGRYGEVFCTDLPGHGEKHTGRKTRLISREGIFEYILAEFDRLQAAHGTVDVFGFSMGGALAHYLAAEREVGRVVLLAPAYKDLFFIYPFYRMKFGREGRRETRAKKKNRELKKPLLGQLITDKAGRREDMKRGAGHFFKVMLPRLGPRNYIAFKRIIRKCNRTARNKILKNPALVVYGRLDQMIPYSVVKRACKGFEDCKVVLYRDITHAMLHSKAGDRIADDIVKFLDSHTE